MCLLFFVNAKKSNGLPGIISRFEDVNVKKPLGTQEDFDSRKLNKKEEARSGAGGPTVEPQYLLWIMC